MSDLQTALASIILNVSNDTEARQAADRILAAGWRPAAQPSQPQQADEGDSFSASYRPMVRFTIPAQPQQARVTEAMVDAGMGILSPYLTDESDEDARCKVRAALTAALSAWQGEGE